MCIRRTELHDGLLALSADNRSIAPPLRSRRQHAGGSRSLRIDPVSQGNAIMTKTTIIKDVHQHVLDLCDKHGITFYPWCRRTSQCHALIDRQDIRIVPIESRLSYASALREIDI